MLVFNLPSRDNRAIRISWLLASLLVAAATPALSAWQTDWESNGPVFDYSVYGGITTASRDGGFTIAAEGTEDVRVLRVDASGQHRWMFAIPYRKYGNVGFNLELADGSVAVSGGGLTLLSPTGTPVWQSRAPMSAAVELGDQIAVAGCQITAAPAATRPAVTLLDRATGAILWQKVLTSEFTTCTDVRIDKDDSDQLYVSARSSPGTRVLKINALGQVVWSVASTGSGELVARGTSVYLHSTHYLSYGNSTLTRLDGATGAPGWQKSCGDARLAFVGDDPLCKPTSSSLQRLNALSANPVWTHAMGVDVLLGVIDGDAYLGSYGRWQRVNGATGQTVWDLVDANFSANIESVLASPAPGSIALVRDMTPGNLRVSRYSATNGAAISTALVPPVSTGVQIEQIASDDNDVYVHGTYDAYTHLRRISMSTGAVVWDKTWTDVQRDNGFPRLALNANGVALSIGTNEGYGLIRLIERATGDLRWNSAFVVTSPFNQTEADVAFGADGDVYYSAITTSTDFIKARHVARLDGTSGTRRWTRTLTEPTQGYFYTLPIEPLDGDLMVGGDTNPDTTLPVQRLSGADGSTQWADISSPPVSSNSAMFVRNDALYAIDFSGVQTGTVSKLDAATGALLWRTSYTDPSIEKFYIFDSVVLPAGDLLIAGYAQIQNIPRLNEARVMRFRADGSGIVYEWKGNDGASLPTGSISGLRLDSQGNPWFRWSRASSDFRVGFLTRFDAELGRPASVQALPLLSANMMREETDWYPLLAAPQNQEILLYGTAYRAGRASTVRVQKLGITPVAYGDLSVTVSPLPPSSVGALVPFRVTTRYAGSGRIVGARTLIRLPWAGRASNLQCTGSGFISCSVSDAYGEVEVTFTADPGAQMIITGNITAQIYPSGTAAIVRAVTAAYPTMVESQTGNNFGASSGERSLFANGFQ